MASTSARMTAPYQTETFSPNVTFPITEAFGAINGLFFILWILKVTQGYAEFCTEFHEVFYLLFLNETPYKTQ